MDEANIKKNTENIEFLIGGTIASYLFRRSKAERSKRGNIIHKHCLGDKL